MSRKSGTEAFRGCTSLMLDIVQWLKNSHIKIISSGAFHDCSGLSGSFNGTISNADNYTITLGGMVFGYTGVIYEKVFNLIGRTEIYANEFSGVSKLVDENGEEVTVLNIPEGIRTIGSNAFNGCGSIETVRLPNSLTTIGDFVFGYCKNLKSVEFSSGCKLDALGVNSFVGDNLLNNVILPESIKTIKAWCFNATGIASIDLSHVEKLRRRSFY